MFEDSRLSGSSLTPRVAVNYLITPRHGLRAVYSEAVRSPDMFENNVNWSYTVKNLTPNSFGLQNGEYFVKTRGPGDLEQERMRSCSRSPGPRVLTKYSPFCRPNELGVRFLTV